MQIDKKQPSLKNIRHVILVSFVPPAFIVAMRAKLYACKMSVDMFGLKKEDFIPGVIDIVTASDFPLHSPINQR